MSKKISHWELWACANHYVRLHGSEAPMIAAARADELLQEGDPEGATTFSRIAQLADQLCQPSGTVH